MKLSSFRFRAAVVVCAAFVPAAVVACGDDSDSDGGAGAAGTVAAGGSNGTQGGSGGAGPSSGGGNSGGGSSKGGSSSGGAGKGGTSSGSGGANGGAQSSGGAGTGNVPQGGMPPAADGGVSPYVPECDDMMMPCLTPGVTCLGIFDENNDVAGFTCSNQCQTVANCSDAPSGAEAEVGCVQFTSASRCVLVCYDNGVESECPSGMSCFRYPDFPIGYCLWP